MSTKQEEYSLLQDQSDRTSDEFVYNDMAARRCNQKSLGWLSWSNMLAILAISGFLNLILAVVIVAVVLRLPGQISVDSASTAATLYANLREDSAFRYPISKGYGPEITNHSLADERWEAIDIDAGVVALSHEWVEEHNLPPSQPFPWDTSKSMYSINAFHTIHCLKNIHRLLYDAHHGRPLSRDIGHAMHCLDHMRMDAYCTASDYLLPTPPGKYPMEGPRGQSRVCRNWDQLVAWATANSACYEHMTDDEEGFAKEHSQLERFRNCPEGSPYKARVEKYFASQE